MVKRDSPLNWSKTTRSGDLNTRGLHRFALMPASLITLVHFSVSSAMNWPNSAGLLPWTTAPTLLNRALIFASKSALLISLLSLLWPAHHRDTVRE
jgi:hypothetical protein